jgi:putative oxidoreductase
MRPSLVQAPSAHRAWQSDLDGAIAAMTRHAAGTLRVMIGVVFVWFGVLKVMGHSPAAALVTQTVRVLPVGHAPVVAMLGMIEIAIGLGLLFGIALRMTLFLFVAQQAGTFLVLIVCPELAFQHHNPLLLTMTGEFVVKNLVFMAGGLVVAAAGEEARRQRIAVL